MFREIEEFGPLAIELGSCWVECLSGHRSAAFPQDSQDSRGSLREPKGLFAERTTTDKESAMLGGIFGVLFPWQLSLVHVGQNVSRGHHRRIVAVKNDVNLLVPATLG